MPDEYAVGDRGFCHPLRDQCRCSAFFVFRRGSTSAFSAWWASMRRLRLSTFQQRLDNGIMPVVVLDSTKAFYYWGLSECEQESEFLRETFRFLQGDQQERFANFTEVTTRD